MKDVKYIACLLFCFIIVAGSTDQCPYKECDCTDVEINCASLRLSSIPTLTSKKFSGITDLNFGSNQITDIPSGSLPSLLRRISFNEDPVETIDDRAFDESANTLNTMHFSNFRFTRIPDALTHLKVFKELSMYQGNIHDWNSDAMRNIGTTLNSLYLVDVGLQEWPDWMQYFTNLTALTVGESTIDYIPIGAIDNFANTLTQLVLSYNRFTAIPQAISKFTALQSIDFSFNKLTDVSWLPQLSKVQTLSLSNNNISDSKGLSNALRPYIESLNNIYITQNSLEIIPDLDFLINIEYLDLTNNRISDPVSGCLATKTDTINLSSNFLPLVPVCFSNITSITNLLLTENAISKIQNVSIPPTVNIFELSYNLITEVTDTSFPQNTSIQFLHLNNNPIAAISYHAFRNVLALVELNLSNTQLARLPLGLAFIKNLTQLHMSDITSLVCTCEEKSVESFILSMPESYVDGKCGHTSIYFFFSNLSPSCPENEIQEII